MDIVFAHFGSPIPKHLMLNLHRTAMLFPQNRVTLITDLDLSGKDIENIFIYKYLPTDEWTVLGNNLMHAKDFRDNFWFTSTARFLALSDFSKSIEREFLHVESDVILAEDFPFSKLSTLESDFMFPVVSDTNAIASCLYIRNHDSANYLANLTLQESAKNSLTTDMYILSALSKMTSVNFIPLPTAPIIYYSNSLASNVFLHKADTYIEHFGGVFDGFDLGRYLFGDDPRNKRGVSILRNNDDRTYLNVRNLRLVTRPERDFPYIYNSSLNSYIPVYSLHIHSKNLDLFKMKKSKRTIQAYVSKSKSNPRKVFIFSVFLRSLFQALKRRLT
jgi:hypothetical protein